ncbi:iron sulfur assembly protein 1 [Salpingoeca rosetta]|uniref:Iron sulfur assembly protein 1 n=1 Tax=Salpingoeca rosetta (strain ATCC 50818 / BSB-021) TaxID=946362 RepID=F2UF13_SALR5|nr:iron sulfur assembly protein 1 [Salpingoeca rosetta]EGD75213.1 iron sulfur assembly protein 1 [Salpingoeca rosetta]|eukprot:XP_004992266.1 iron sulfur assembly protein 1 [Salpingoeca rosetta]
MSQVYRALRHMSAIPLRAVTKPSKARAPKAVLQVTPAAADRIKTLLKDKPDAVGLRVSVRDRGCTGNSFHLDYAYDKDAKKFDEVIEQHGVKVIVDSGAILRVLHSTMDFSEGDEAEGFVFENPQAKGTCGCGESFFF